MPQVEDVVKSRVLNWMAALGEPQSERLPGDFALKPRWSASWNFSRVEGLMKNADYRIWGRLRNNDHKPSKNRSITERLGARFRERLITGTAVSLPRLRLNEMMLS